MYFTEDKITEIFYLTDEFCTEFQKSIEGHLLGNRPVPVLRRRHRHREPRRRKRRRRRHVDKRQAAAPWRCRNVCTCNLLLK